MGEFCHIPRLSRGDREDVVKGKTINKNKLLLSCTTLQTTCAFFQDCSLVGRALEFSVGG